MRKNLLKIAISRHKIRGPGQSITLGESREGREDEAR